MQKTIIAFDVDGTLRKNTDEVHRTKIVPNRKIVRMFEALATFKNVELHIWSNRGSDYCREIAALFDLTEYCKGYHKKLWAMQQEAERKAGKNIFRPNIAIDDQQRFDGADVVLVVHEKGEWRGRMPWEA